MRYKFTDVTSQNYINTHVIRLEQWPKSSKTARGKGEQKTALGFRYRMDET